MIHVHACIAKIFCVIGGDNNEKSTFGFWRLPTI